MPKIHVSRILPAPVEDVWSLVRPLDSYGQWFPELGNCRVEGNQPVDQVGAIRRFTYDGQVIRELSDVEYRRRYTIVENPVTPGVRNYLGTLEFRPLSEGNRTLGCWTSEFEGSEPVVANTKEVVTNVFRTGLGHLEEIFSEASHPGP